MSREEHEFGGAGPNYSRWLEMNKPHEDKESMTAALEKFFLAVEDAREKFRIAEVEIIVGVKCLVDGKDAESLGRFHLGDPLRAEGMAAFAYGLTKKEREETTALLLAGSARTQKNQKYY